MGKNRIGVIAYSMDDSDQKAKSNFLNYIKNGLHKKYNNIIDIEDITNGLKYVYNNGCGEEYELIFWDVPTPSLYSEVSLRHIENCQAFIICKSGNSEDKVTDESLKEWKGTDKNRKNWFGAELFKGRMSDICDYYCNGSFETADDFIDEAYEIASGKRMVDNFRADLDRLQRKKENYEKLKKDIDNCQKELKNIEKIVKNWESLEKKIIANASEMEDKIDKADKSYARHKDSKKFQDETNKINQKYATIHDGIIDKIDDCKKVIIEFEKKYSRLSRASKFEDYKPGVEVTSIVTEDKIEIEKYKNKITEYKNKFKDYRPKIDEKIRKNTDKIKNLNELIKSYGR